MPYYISKTRKKLQKIGNSLMVSISPYQAEKIGIKAGDDVGILLDTKYNEIIVTKDFNKTFSRLQTRSF